MKSSEIRELSPEEAGKKLRDLRERLVLLRVQKRAGTVENPNEIRVIRRDIARLETILKEKQKAAAAA